MVEQFGRLEPQLPRDTRGKPRVDDRRVISGIVPRGRLLAFLLTGGQVAVHIVATVAHWL
ncbi:hypothetical protein Sp245p_12310 [Azospirillum baldaniorum]|nr:hypothetical protein Sp245p_12310 [Azospirillum baldaniorum]